MQQRSVQTAQQQAFSASWPLLQGQTAGGVPVMLAHMLYALLPQPVVVDSAHTHTHSQIAAANTPICVQSAGTPSKDNTAQPALTATHTHRESISPTHTHTHAHTHRASHPHPTKHGMSL